NRVRTRARLNDIEITSIPDTTRSEIAFCRAMWGMFFFRAEDGIRDRNVTGVQTCAFRSQKKLNFCNRFFMKACQSDLKNVWTLKIGRASCRERVEIWEGDGAVKRKRDRDDQGEQSAGERQVKSEEGHDERTKQRGIRQHQ